MEILSLCRLEGSHRTVTNISDFSLIISVSVPPHTPMPNPLNILFKALKSRCTCDAYTCVHVDVETRSHVRCHRALHLLSETECH